MIKDIKYNGYAAQPSDYECPDGQQAGMLNLIPEDSALKPLFPPKPILDCNLGGIVKLVHHVPNQDNYIIARDVDNHQRLYWLRKSDVYANEENAVYIATYSGLKDIAIVGNTLVIATHEGLRYILWKDGNYIILQSKPPFVPISFGMRQAGTCTDSKDLNITFEQTTVADHVVMADTEENSNAIFGLLLSSIKENVTDKGYFYVPFFVRYAYRLYDGSYSWHSAPILMLPMVIPPIMEVGGGATSDGVHSIPTRLSVPYFSLDYKILDDGHLDSLNDWKDLIAGIDVFISAPIYTYDQSKRIKRLGESRSVLLNSYYNWNPDGLDLRTHPEIVPDKVFVGHYSTHLTSSFVDHYMLTDSASNHPVWELPLNSKFHDDIKSVSNFYKIASIKIDAVSAMDDYKRLPIKANELEALVNRATLPDDYQSHCEFSADYLLAFNSRLNLADVRLTPAQPFPLKSAVQATSPTDEEQPASIVVYTRLNGVLCSVTSQLASVANNWDLEKNFPRYIYYPDAAAYKMVFKYGEKQIIIDLTPHDFLNGAYWYGSLAVDPKPTTNAETETRPTALSVPMGNKVYTSEVNNPFYFPVNGINTVGSGSIIGISTAAKALSQGQFGQFPLYAFTTEGVWALEVGANGFYTARQPITRDVCTNAKGITQLDNAVLFPSSRGVMLLSGANSTCVSELIGTETPFNLAILPGMADIALLSGCTSNQYLYTPFGEFLKTCRMIYDYTHQRIFICGKGSCAYVYSLKSKDWGIMANVVKSTVDSYPDALAMSHDGKLVDFSQKYVGWIYSTDTLFPTTPTIQLGTSLEDLTGWTAADQSQHPARGAAHNALHQSPLAEPQTNCSEMRSNGFFVTRPLKLETPDILKTIDTVIQRGHFRKGHVQSAIYGSRDLFNWHLVWSSKDHFLRGFRGSPYKYFRIACVTSLAEDECVFGASLQFTPRQTNQPR